ncbi:hypothetical protein TNCV_1954791 [Trichonephila clavipes]|nr:hypothetical protein TNCV_1954791 [Trichonephila clavipes]
MECGEEDQIQSFINHIRNLALLTSSKNNELNGQVTLLEWTKKFSMPKPIGIRRKGRPNLRWIDGLEKYLPVLRTKNWRTLARRRLA